MNKQSIWPWHRPARQSRRLALNAEDFKALVEGGEVERDGVAVILDDIGFDVMYATLNVATVRRG